MQASRVAVTALLVALAAIKATRANGFGAPSSTTLPADAGRGSRP